MDAIAEKLVYVKIQKYPIFWVLIYYFSKMKTLKFYTSLILFAATAANANPPISVYDGFWVGRTYCSANISPNGDPKYAKPYDNKITFTVFNGTGTANFDTAEIIDKFDIKIESNGNVKITQLGSQKKNSNRAWIVESVGAVNAGTITTRGNMKNSDKSEIVRSECGLQLSNNEVINKIAKFQEDELKAKLAESEKNLKKQAAEKQNIQTKTAEPRIAKSATSTEVPAEKQRITTEPKPAIGKDAAPARVASIGNIDSKATNQNSSKVTSNPIDKMGTKSSNDVWISFNPSITVQERQFCRLVENYRVEVQAARATQNQIKVNESNKNLVQALNSLLPDGKFQGWVMRSITVGQASDGSADILFQLPCDVLVGSNACDANPKNFYGTIPEGSRLYSELTKMTVGDFSLVSGEFAYADPKAFDKSRSVASFAFMKTADHCKAKSVSNNSDFFGIKLTTLSMIK